MRTQLLALSLVLAACHPAPTIQNDTVLGVAQAGANATVVFQRVESTIDYTYDYGELANPTSSRLYLAHLDGAGKKLSKTPIDGSQILGFVALDDGSVIVQNDSLNIVHFDGTGTVIGSATSTSCGTGLQRSGDGVWVGTHAGPLCRVDASSATPTFTLSYSWAVPGGANSDVLASNLVDTMVGPDGSFAAVTGTYTTSGQQTATVWRWDSSGNALASFSTDDAIAVRNGNTAGQIVIFIETTQGLTRQVLDATNQPVSETESTGDLGGNAITFDSDGGSLVVNLDTEQATHLDAQGRSTWTAAPQFSQSANVIGVATPIGYLVSGQNIVSPSPDDQDDPTTTSYELVAIDGSGQILWQADSASF